MSHVSLYWAYQTCRPFYVFNKYRNQIWRKFSLLFLTSITFLVNIYHTDISLFKTYKKCVHLVLESTHDELFTDKFRFPVDVHKKSDGNFKITDILNLRNDKSEHLE